MFGYLKARSPSSKGTQPLTPTVYDYVSLDRMTELLLDRCLRKSKKMSDDVRTLAWARGKTVLRRPK
jgi:hypothetical protein